MTRWLFLLLVIALLQLLTATFTLSLRWLVGRLIINRWVVSILFLLTNILLVAAVSRIFHGGFAIFATVLALLWIWFIVAVCIFILQKLIPMPTLWKIALPVVFLIITGWGWFNAHNPTIIRYTITLDKPTAPFRILLASDLHLGRQTGNRALDYLRAIADTENPDLILLPGDIINDDARPYLDEKMDENLAKLHAPYGVYMTLGNHEHYGILSENIQALRKSGHSLLLDESIETHGIIIIGREDNTNPNRKTLTELLPTNTNKPIIVLDHQPKDIMTASQLPIDIVVSGHTHRGQIFPANFITKMLYRLDYGYEKIGHGNFFTTSGYGFWGVPLRLASRSEVMIVDVVSKQRF